MRPSQFRIVQSSFIYSNKRSIMSTRDVDSATAPSPASRRTRLVHAGRHPEQFGGAVNTPVVRTSTVLYPDLAAYEDSRAHKFGSLRYGRYGTQTAFALQEAMTELEGAAGAVLYPSGLAAISSVLRALLAPGDHLLMVDSVYGPARQFCDGALRRAGVETTYFDPAIGGGIADLLRPRTRVVYGESPGSLTFEVQDLPAIAQACRRSGALLVVDNTWASPLFHRPLELGADVSISAATKYVVGHSDAMLGVAATNERALDAVRAGAAADGLLAGPDDCWLALRGLRSMGARLRQHEESALFVAHWLARHPAVRRVLYPALPGDPSHELWKRDFSGASGLFSFELARPDPDRLRVFIDGLALFGIGSSWGGFESLVLPAKPVRTASHLPVEGALVRLHIGLEDPNDLVGDLARALDAAYPDPHQQGA
ncbi:cystathionine beta-lyase [Ancylobacter terrae]|uniref:cystathionine beta-lyase n=1 Tax=Ancylobacter sp. sgz301288 TaxID=3342077 RepID=UPI0038588EC2